MPPPTTTEEFLVLLRKSAVADSDLLSAHLERLRLAGLTVNLPKDLARSLVEQGILTFFQAEQLLLGRWRGFHVGKYNILERIASGGMGVVYLAEHSRLQRRVAIKVLPVALAKEPWFLERFYREAQAIAALDHPNIVHAHDIDQEGDLHFLVMEYVDGSSLQTIVAKSGPMACERVPHYLWQATLGLQHAHEAGFVHRDIKPGNLVLDRQGVIKILDMGLAHFFAHTPLDVFASNDNVKRMVGTDDYLAPEQIVDSDEVDIRADIYSLGATAYYMLTGTPPFGDSTNDNHKLIWHITKRPKALREIRPEIPEALAIVIEKMMAKNPWERYQLPREAAEALMPLCQHPIPPPPEEEMPGLSLAAQRSGTQGTGSSAARRAAGRSSWVVFGGPPQRPGNNSTPQAKEKSGPEMPPPPPAASSNPP